MSKKNFMRKFIDAAGNDPYALEKAADKVIAQWEEFMDDFGGREETMPWELDPDSGDFDDAIPEYDQMVYDAAKEFGVGYDALRVYMHERYKAERYG